MAQLNPLGSADVGCGVWAWSVFRPSPAKRGVCFHQALVERPGSCIRRLGGSRAREMQFTRFLRNRSVTASEMAAYAAEGTALRATGREVVAIADASDLILGGRRKRREGFGPVGGGGALGGLMLHAVLAVEVGTGGPLLERDFHTRRSAFNGPGNGTSVALSTARQSPGTAIRTRTYGAV